MCGPPFCKRFAGRALAATTLSVYETVPTNPIIAGKLRINSRFLRHSAKLREQAPDEINRSTEAVRRLQRQMQAVYAWTKRINIEGRWIALDEFLTNNLNTKLTYGVFSQAMQEVQLTVDETEVPAAT
jgi:peptidoglycan hydrolase-like protein with peptidoglycan-binding domain